MTNILIGIIIGTILMFILTRLFPGEVKNIHSIIDNLKVKDSQGSLDITQDQNGSETPQKTKKPFLGFLKRKRKRKSK